MYFLFFDLLFLLLSFSLLLTHTFFFCSLSILLYIYRLGWLSVFEIYVSFFLSVQWIKGFGFCHKRAEWGEMRENGIMLHIHIFVEGHIDIYFSFFSHLGNSFHSITILLDLILLYGLYILLAICSMIRAVCICYFLSS